MLGYPPTHPHPLQCPLRPPPPPAAPPKHTKGADLEAHGGWVGGLDNGLEAPPPPPPAHRQPNFLPPKPP